MAKTVRKINTPTRTENVRDKRQTGTALCFTLGEVKGHFTQNLSAIRAQSAVAEEMLARGDRAEAEFIWRTQILYLESALDYYMHELTNYGMVQMFARRWPRTSDYARIKLEIGAIDAGVASPGSAEWLVEYVGEVFGRDTLTNYPRIKDQADLLGLDITSIMRTAFPAPKNAKKRSNPVGYGAEILSELCTRRNRIAHQTDRDPKNARQTAISGKYVTDSIGHIERLVNALHHAAAQKDRA